jgi:hypothetical protein
MKNHQLKFAKKLEKLIVEFVTKISYGEMVGCLEFAKMSIILDAFDEQLEQNSRDVPLEEPTQKEATIN